MNTPQEAFARLKMAINIKHYIGARGANLIEEACLSASEAPEAPEALQTEAEIDAALFEGDED